MWKLRDIVVAVILSVVAGVIYFAWNGVYDLVSASTMWVQGGINGMWWIGSALVPFIIRRPGAALFVGIISAVVEMALGGQWGVSTLWAGLLQGGGAELAFVFFAWKRYGTIVMSLAGVLGGIGSLIQWYWQYGGSGYATFDQVAYIVSTVVSGIVLAGVLPTLIGQALYRTGTLRNFEIAKQARAGAQ